MSPPTPTIDSLLNLVPDSPDRVLSLLTSRPSLASAQDRHGYSLLHAAASYSHLPLLRTLVRTYGVSPNIADEDNETPLFAAESVDVATCLVEELGADVGWRNEEGLTAEEKVEAEGEWPLVGAYLRAWAAGKGKGQGGEATKTSEDDGAVEESSNDAHPPPPLPQNVRINVGTMEELPADEAQAPDPEFRRRIEELAAREDFRGEEGQRQLRDLVTEAVTGLAANGQSRDVRRRVG